MKISIDIIKPFLSEVNLLLEGIKDTIRSGDDGLEESCLMQVNDLLRHLKTFSVEKLIPLTPVTRRTPSYLLKAEQTDYTTDDKSVDENVAYYKARLYYFIKKNLPKIAGLDMVKSLDLFNAIESAVICGSSYEQHFYSKEFSAYSDAVLRDIVQEIEDYRKAHPQTTLF